jgi:hypothetical protein
VVAVSFVKLVIRGGSCYVNLIKVSLLRTTSFDAGRRMQFARSFSSDEGIDEPIHK